MKFTPQPLGIFANLYGTEEGMTISKALLVALVGFITVIVLLAIIALFIKAIAGIFSVFMKKKKAAAPAPAAAKAATAPAKSASKPRGDILLVDVDEPTAAVIMALVSHNSGIPLEKLEFKSIKLLEDEK